MKVNFRGLVGIGAIIIFLSGCATAPTRVEKEERAKVSQAERVYREKVNLPELSEESSLPEFIRYALLNNPKVEAAFYRWKEAVETIAVSRYLPNPQLSFEAEISSGGLEMLEPGLMFMLPASGKIPLQAEAFSLEAKKYRHLFEDEILKAAFRLQEVVYQYWVLNEKIKSTQRVLKLIEDLEELSLANLTVGKVSLSDVLLLQIEKEEMSNRIADLKDSQKVLREQFRASLGIKPGEPVPQPPSDLVFTPEEFPEEQMWEIAQRRYPRLELMRTRIAESEVFVKMAYKEYSPDFALGLMKSFFSEMSLIKPLLSLSLPWRKKVASQIAASKAGLEGAKAELSVEELDLLVILAEASFRWRQADREFKLYKYNLLPKAEAILDLQRSSYIVGTTGLNEVLTAERMWLEFSLNYLSASGMREIALNEILICCLAKLPEEVFFEQHEEAR
ncbi:MAG: TolC family protein [Atribacterota bacterium]|nr:TolC family protein [Atribacterota bacterium]